jgi:hypothetical protein
MLHSNFIYTIKTGHKPTQPAPNPYDLNHVVPYVGIDIGIHHASVHSPSLLADIRPKKAFAVRSNFYLWPLKYTSRP